MVKMNWLLRFFPLIALKFCSRGSPSCHLSTHLSPGLVCISLSSSFTWIPSPTHYNHKPLLGTVARCGVVYTICKSCSLTCVHPEVTQTDTVLEGPKFTLGCRDLLEKKTHRTQKSATLVTTVKGLYWIQQRERYRGGIQQRVQIRGLWIHCCGLENTKCVNRNVRQHREPVGAVQLCCVILGS